MIRILLLSCVPCQTTQDLPPDPSFRGLGNILMGHANIYRVSASATSFARLLPCWTFPLPHISNFYLRCWRTTGLTHLSSSCTCWTEWSRSSHTDVTSAISSLCKSSSCHCQYLLFMILIVTDRRYIIRIIFKSIIFCCWCSMKLSSFSFCSVISEKGLHYYDLILWLSHSLQPQS